MEARPDGCSGWAAAPSLTFGQVRSSGVLSMPYQCEPLGQCSCIPSAQSFAKLCKAPYGSWRLDCKKRGGRDSKNLPRCVTFACSTHGLHTGVLQCYVVMYPMSSPGARLLTAVIYAICMHYEVHHKTTNQEAPNLGPLCVGTYALPEVRVRKYHCKITSEPLRQGSRRISSFKQIFST